MTTQCMHHCVQYIIRVLHGNTMLLASTNAQERDRDSMDIKILPLWSGVVAATLSNSLVSVLSIKKLYEKQILHTVIFVA